MNILRRKYTILAGNNNESVLDYKIVDLVYVLIRKNNEYFLQLYSPDSDRKITDLPLENIKGYELFIDCFSNVHILNEDSANQIYYDVPKNNFTLIKRISRSDFEAKIRNCAISADNSLLYIIHNYHKHSMQCIAINKFDGKSKIIHESKNIEAAKVSNEDLKELISLYHQIVPEGENIILNNVWDGEVRKLTYMGNIDLLRMVTWYLNISTNLAKSSIFQKGNSFILYDNLQNRVIEWDKNWEIISEARIDFSNSSRWQGIIPEYSSDNLRLFVHFQNQISTIKEINVFNGTYTGYQFVINYHKFPQNLQISSNKVFYMHSNQGGKMKLIYQNLQSPPDAPLQSTNR